MPLDFPEIIEGKAEFIDRRKTYLLSDRSRYFSPNEVLEQSSFALRGSQRVLVWKKQVVLSLSRVSSGTTWEETVLNQEFRSLADAWYAETAFESSLTKMTMNLNYLRAISLGKPVVPLILRELERKPAPWFLALKAITGEDPVSDRFAGDFKVMAETWIEWGKERGLI
jgi:hypothetical protein